MFFRKFKKFSKKYLVAFFILIFLLPTTTAFGQLAPIIPFIPTTNPPPGAVPTADSDQATKEVAITILGFRLPNGINLDSITYMALEAIASQLTDGIVTWINNGFEGGPFFAVDLEGRLLDTADAIAGKIIQDIGAGALCSPFIGNLQNALKLTQNYRSQRNTDDLIGSCTLSQVSQNIEGFFDGDFIGGGGWDAWYVMTQTTYGNPYSSYLNFKFETDTRVASALQLDQEQLSWGKGFLSKQECEIRSPDGNCAKWGPIETPGTVIEDQLNRVFGWEGDRLNLADEFDEIVGALLGQLVDVVFSPGGSVFSTGSGIYSRNSSSSANAPGAIGSCFPDKNQVILNGEPVTWRFSGRSLGPEDTITWSGDGGLSGSGTSATITYTGNPSNTSDVGNKFARVTYTRVTKVQGQPDVVRTDQISCQPAVEVLRFPPLAVSCTVSPYSTAPGGTLNWEVRVTGGSGIIRTFNLYDNTTDEGPLEEQVVARSSRRDGSDTVYSYLIRYLSPGEKSITVNVVDADQFTRPVTSYRCSETAYVSP